MFTKWQRFLYLLVLPLFATACQIHKPLQDPEKELSLPISYSKDVNPNNTLSGYGDWWLAFQNPLLDQVIAKSLKENLDISVALDRLQASEAAFKVHEANIWPSLDLAFNATRQRSFSAPPPSNEKVVNYTTALALSPKLSYEIDLMNRVSSLRKEAYHKNLAAEDYLQATELRVSGQSAKLWLNKLLQQKIYYLTQRQLKTSIAITQLIELKYQYSENSMSDLLQQKALISAKESALPLIYKAYNNFHHQLNLLHGSSDFSEESISHFDFELPKLPPLPQLNSPKDLLYLRPDVRMHYQLLLATDQQLAHAIAMQFPALSLDFSYQFKAKDLENLLESQFAYLTAQVMAPLFHGGAIQANIEAKKALLSEQLTLFKKSYFQALHEIEQSLQNEYTLLEHEQKLKKHYQYVQRAFEQAKNNYINGVSPYLYVLNALNALEEAEIKLLKSQIDLLANRIDLYLAIGREKTTPQPS